VKFFVRASVLLSMLLLSGCSDVWCWPFDCSSSKSSSGVVDDNSDESDSDDTTTDPNPTEFNLDKVTWLHTNVSSWPVTNTLKVSTGGGVICMNVDGRQSWPTVGIPHHSGTKNVEVNANGWIFAYHNGKWYGATWEWWAPNTTCKPMHEMAPRKAPPLNTWEPESGEVFYVMMSGLARGSERNVAKRTNIVKIVWP
jgi:hypothetical protein